MLRRFGILGLVVGALALAAPPAHAALISGGFSVTGGLKPYAGPGYTNPVADISTANVLDFGSNGAAAGAYRNGSCSGDFTAILGPCDPIVGTLGSIKDLDITGYGPAGGPYALANFMTSINGFAMDLASIYFIDRAVANQLTIKGLGTLAATGYSATPGTWNFTGNSAGGTFSWSASVSAVPEPTSMMLLGTGLIGLAGAARRRFRKNG